MDWFRDFQNAINQATFRAAITGYRYKIKKDEINGWWDIKETTVRLESWLTP